MFAGSMDAVRRGRSLLGEALASGNLSVLASLLGPAFRGLALRRGKQGDAARIDLGHPARLDLAYSRTHPDLARLYEIAKQSQWNAATDLDWSVPVDPEERQLVPAELLPVFQLDAFRRLSPRQQADQRRAFLAWTLSQFLHGEQGALFAAAQVTEAVPWLDGKLYGSTQVVDEGRHVEVFHRYLTGKLEKLYAIDDNLYVVIDALMTDSRWDVKFLGMQIMVEGLALGAFGAIRRITDEPLLRDVLRYVITDEARHVHYGVLALERLHTRELSERERRWREDWAFEMSLFLRNRFLALEFYEEYWAHAMGRSEWDRLALASGLMSIFRESMFKRILPNLARIGLLSRRIRPRYAELGLLRYADGKAAPELTAAELIEER